MKWSEAKGAQSCPTLCDPTDYTVHGILQARILEWVDFPFPRGPSQPRVQTQISHIAGRFFTNLILRVALNYWKRILSIWALLLSVHIILLDIYSKIILKYSFDSITPKLLGHICFPFPHKHRPQRYLFLYPITFSFESYPPFKLPLSAQPKSFFFILIVGASFTWNTLFTVSISFFFLTFYFVLGYSWLTIL